MANSYFISDAHLGAGDTTTERLKEDKLLSFFDHAAKTGERLFIVGDLFDFWFEYRNVIPRGYARILAGLSRMRESGLELHYIAGNHDFWMRDYFPKELGIPIHFDNLEYTINGKRFFLEHGDGIAKDDTGYRILKRIFRNRVNIFLYSLLHPDIGVPLAKWVSSLSRGHTSKKEFDDDDYILRAREKFQQGFDYVLFAHLHHPILKTMGHNIYLNLGDWMKHFTYAVFDDTELRLEKW